MMIGALIDRAKSTRRPWKDDTSTRGSSAYTRSSSSTRSLTSKRGCFTWVAV